MPTSSASRRAAALVVAGEQDGRAAGHPVAWPPCPGTRPEPVGQCEHPDRELVGDTTTAVGPPPPARQPGAARGPVQRSSGGRASRRGRRLPRPWRGRPGPGMEVKSSPCGDGQPALPGRGARRPRARGCSLGRSAAAASASSRVLVEAGAEQRLDLGDAGRALGEGAGLVERDHGRSCRTSPSPPPT